MFQHRQIFEVSNTSFCNLEIFQNTFEQFWLNALPDADDDMLLEKKHNSSLKKRLHSPVQGLVQRESALSAESDMTQCQWRYKHDKQQKRVIIS